MKEQVLVFQQDLFDVYPKGFSKEADIYLDKILYPSNLLFLDRETAEKDPTHKQVIPYCMLGKTDGTIFVYQRTKKSGEKRLHGNYSLGIGGHINPSDAKNGNSYLVGMERELDEEVSISERFISNFIRGVLYDDSNEVGRVHFGVVHHYTFPAYTNIELKEDALTKGEFWTISEIRANIAAFENWSQLTFKELWG